MKLSSGRREILSKTQALKDIIKQKVVKRLLLWISPPSNSPDAGRVMTDSLLSYLTKNSSGDVKILKRRPGALLKEIELGQAGLYDIESAKKAGKLKDLMCSSSEAFFSTMLKKMLMRDIRLSALS